MSNSFLAQSRDHLALPSDCLVLLKPPCGGGTGDCCMPWFGQIESLGGWADLKCDILYSYGFP